MVSPTHQTLQESLTESAKNARLFEKELEAEVEIATTERYRSSVRSMATLFFGGCNGIRNGRFNGIVSSLMRAHCNHKLQKSC